MINQLNAYHCSIDTPPELEGEMASIVLATEEHIAKNKYQQHVGEKAEEVSIFLIFAC